MTSICWKDRNFLLRFVLLVSIYTPEHFSFAKPVSGKYFMKYTALFILACIKHCRPIYACDQTYTTFVSTSFACF